MGEYTIKSRFINDQTDFRLATSGIAYEIEKAHINHVNHLDIGKQIERLKKDDQFPSNLDQD